jgi:hypothetical protein
VKSSKDVVDVVICSHFTVENQRVLFFVLLLLAGNTAVVTELISCCLAHSSICMPNVVLYTENSSVLAKFFIFINGDGSY